MVTVCFPYFQKIFVQRFGLKRTSDDPASSQMITQDEFKALFAEDLANAVQGTQADIRQFRAKNTER